MARAGPAEAPVRPQAEQVPLAKLAVGGEAAQGNTPVPWRAHRMPTATSEHAAAASPSLMFRALA